MTPILGEGRAVLLTPPGNTHDKGVRDGVTADDDHLAQLRFRGQGPRFVKHGRMILYPQDAVAEWLEAGETDCTRSMR